MAATHTLPGIVVQKSSGATVPSLRMELWGDPANDHLTGLWDAVEDRLFEIRHCLNIEAITSADTNQSFTFTIDPEGPDLTAYTEMHPSVEGRV